MNHGARSMRLIRSGGRASSGGGTFVRSIKQECLRHIIPLGERHLRTTVHEFVEHYLWWRNTRFPRNFASAAVGASADAGRMSDATKVRVAYCPNSRSRRIHAAFRS
jgi:hypothetical protein